MTEKITRARIEGFIRTLESGQDPFASGEIDVHYICTLALHALAMRPLLKRVAKLHLRESNAVKDNAVASIHDAAAIVRDVRAFLTSLPEPRR